MAVNMISTACVEDVEVALSDAKRSLRGIDVSHISQHDLVSARDTGMFTRTNPMAMGEVDAFISHSWQVRGSE